jgi:hypothetical protein
VYVLLLVVLLVMVVCLIEQDPGAHSVRAASCCVVGDGCVSDCETRHSVVWSVLGVASVCAHSVHTFRHATLRDRHALRTCAC